MLGVYYIRFIGLVVGDLGVGCKMVHIDWSLISMNHNVENWLVIMFIQLKL